MFTNILIVSAVTTTTALVWRALLLDHPRFLSFIENIPLVGGALRCGFCTALWLSLAAVLIDDPLSQWSANLPFFIHIWTDWFALGVVVLLMRNTITALMEGTGVLTHLHRSHDDQK